MITASEANQISLSKYVDIDGPPEHIRDIIEERIMNACKYGKFNIKVCEVDYDDHNCYKILSGVIISQ